MGHLGLKCDFTFIPCGNHQKNVSVCLFFNFFIFLLVSSCGYRYDSKAFLFSLVNKPGWAPVKLTQTGQESYQRAHSTYSCSSSGPTFGGHDIYVSDYASSNTNSYENLGYTYAAPSGNSYGSTFTRTFLTGSYLNFQPDEIETFYETT